MNTAEAQVIQAKNGSPTVKITLSDGRSLLLHSTYDPQAEARRWASDIEVAPRDILLVYGVGAGHGVNALLKRLWNSNWVFVVEPLESVRRACEELPAVRAAHSDARVRVVSGWSDVKNQFDEIEDSCWRRLKLVVTPVYRRVAPQALEELSAAVLKQSNLLENFRSTVRHSAEMWQSNLFANLPQLAESAPISRIFGALSRKPAIIVSAGPSLDKNVELLREARDHALIISTGTAARLLAQRGIDTDLVLTVDGAEVNYLAHFQDVTHTDSVLAFDLTAHPLIPRKHRGCKAVLSIYPDCEWLNQYLTEPIGRIKTGGSVSNVAFDLACKLDADPIILIGQDLSYPSAKSHASGTFHEHYRTNVPEAWLAGDMERLASERTGLARSYMRRNRILVPDVSGGMVPTDQVLLSFLTWFEREIADLDGERAVIDATEGGALIRGTQILSLQETLDRFCAAPITPTTSNIRMRLSQPARVDFDQMQRDLRDIKPQVQYLQANIREAAGLCGQLPRCPQDGASLSPQDRLSILDARILKGVEELKWRFHFLLTPFLVQAQDLSPWRELEPAQAAEQRNLIYATLGPLTRTGERLLDGALCALEEHGWGRSQPLQ